MMSLSAFLATLPPVALAETDLARFVALVIGRRHRAELPGVALLLAEENLRGYPAGLGAVMRASIEELLADETPPELVDAASVEMMFGRETFIARLGRFIEVRRERLRPGTIVGPELRMLAGKRLQILASWGGQPALVYPVDLARVPDAHFAVPRGPVLAMLMAAADADVLRETWAIIEGATGLDGVEAERWLARFFAIARRPAIDVAAVQKAIVRMSPELRARLAEAVVAHARDGRLPEHHRPGPRGLERRLARLGIEADAPWVEALVGLVSHAFEGAGVDPDVERGYCFVPAEDLALWSQWVEVPAAARDRVAAMAPEAIEAALMVLAEVEAGRVDRALDPVLRRGLQSLRDHCLRPRWTKSRAVLEGLDLLRLCDAFMVSGWDLESRRTALRDLAAEAEALGPRVPERAIEPPPALAELEPGAWVLGTTAQRAEPVAEVRQAPVVSQENVVQKGLAASPPPAEVRAPDVRPRTDVRPAEARPTSTRFALPPMPKPPPLGTRAVADTPAGRGVVPLPAERAAERERQRSRVLGRETAGVASDSAQPSPMVKDALEAEGGRKAGDADSGRRAGEGDISRLSSGFAEPAARDTRPPSSLKVPKPMPAQQLAPAPERRSEPLVMRAPEPPVLQRLASQRAPTERGPVEPRSARRPTTGGLLVTPAQAHAFYEQAFRELETVERDILKLGRADLPPSLAARLDHIADEAAAVAAALGPAARSGDRDFQVALERIERVEEYLLRVRGLGLGSPGPRDDRPKSFWRRLLGSKND
jgi:hypothetical protein